MTESLAIGDLARATGVKATTIRFYEAEGLLPPPGRSEGGHRVYARAHLDRLGFIRHARELGFPMDDIRELLRLADAAPDAPCAGADDIARRHLTSVRERLARLRSLEAELARMTTCAHGTIAECRVIEVLADAAHGHCADPAHGLRTDPAIGAEPGRGLRRGRVKARS
jgi:DNA-binding transcriptional MerR regulator